MNSNQKEILERVLLMMKYDSSKTLNENIRVISEQPNPNAPNIREAINKDIEARKSGTSSPSVENIPTFRDTPLTLLNWLNNQSASKSNTYKYSQKEFDSVLDLFLNQLSNMTLKQLVELQLSYKRSITPGFIGFQNAKNTNFADVLVDNEIYLRRLNGEKGYPADDILRIRGEKPYVREPQYGLLNAEVSLDLSPYKNKGAKQILDDKLKKQQEEIKRKKIESDKKAVEQAEKIKQNYLNQGCPFGDKKDGDAFRKWYVETYPEIAKTYALSKSGEFCNTNIKNASKHVLNNKSMIERYYTYTNYMTVFGGQIGKKESSNQPSNCFFKDKRQGDEFRDWFNTNYPSLAAKEKYNLSKKGDFCNTNIKNALNHSITEGPLAGKKIKDIYSEKIKWEFDMTPSNEVGSLTYDELFQRMNDEIPEELKKYFNKQDDSVLDTPGVLAWRSKVASDKATKEEWETWKKSIRFKSYPKILDYHMGKPVYSENSIEITAQDINDPSKTKDYVIGIMGEDIDKAIESFYYNTLKEKYRQSVLDEDIIYEIFSKESIEDALASCDEEKVLSFLQGIIDGSIKNKQGQTVGKYYNNSAGKPVIAKWNSPKIPCESVFWRDYGLYIQLGSMVAISILSGGLGLGPSATIFLELAADTAINLYSLSKSVEAQDDDAIKMDLAYVFLPLLMASGPVKAALKSAKFGDDVIKSVESKLKSLPPNATKTQVDDLLKNMTPQEQRVIKELGSEEYKDVVQKASKDVVDGIKKTAKAPIGRKISNPLINILVYGAPAGSYIYKKLTDIDSILDKNNLAKLSQEEKELWGRALSFLSAQDQDELINALSNLSTDSLENVLRTANSEKIIDDYFSSSITDEQRKKNAENIKKDMENFMKDLESNVKEESGEDLDIEIVIE